MIIMRPPRYLAGVIVVVLLTAVACSKSSQSTSGQQTTLKVAFVYNSPVGDSGWTYTHDQGRAYLQSHLPGVKITVLQNIPEGASSEPVFERLAQQGNKLIFGTSFGYMDPMLQAGAKYPDTAFLYTSGYKSSKNVTNYYGATEQGLYLAGQLAGKTTKSNILGFVGSFPIASVLYQINAFTLGARSVNPNVETKVVFSSTWYDPSKEKQAANSLMNAGADILTETEDSPAVGEAAQARGMHWVGFSGSDMSKFAPDAWLTGVDFNWGPFYLKTAKEIIAGTWKATPYYGSMADGNVLLGPFGQSVPNSLQSYIDDQRKAIIDGTLQPFAGPIMDNQGNLIETAGKVLSVAQLNTTNYFVQGVVGSVPSS
jgi:basic membrane protein A and related proteins